MMLDSDYSGFQVDMNALFASFPRFRMGPADRADMVTVWWRRLRVYGSPAVREAMAWAEDQEQIPNLGAVVSRARLADARLRGEEELHKPQGEISEAEREEARQARAAVPRTTEAQLEYVKAADTEGERLARVWEVEDLLLNRVPWADTPGEKAQKRLASVMSLLERMVEP